jgi:RHS repeat-associated protein
MVEYFPDNVDFNVGVILAHSPNSNKSGVLYKRNNEPLVLKSKNLSIEKMSDYLELKMKQAAQDGQSDGGEMGLLSLESAIDNNLDSIRSAGLFREDAALVIVFVADEQDICAEYPEGVTPIPDPQKKEDKSFKKYCVDSSGQRIITPQTTYNKIKSINGDLPLVMGGILYDETSIIPNYAKGKEENEIGYGYLETLRLHDRWINIDLAQGKYGDGLSRLGRLALSTMNLPNTFELRTDKVDPASIFVTLDGYDFDHNYLLETNEVSIDENRDQLATIHITYCDDKTAPVIEIFKTEEEVTMNPFYSIDGFANDTNSVITQLKKNGEIIAEEEGSDFLFNVELDEGSNLFELVAIDRAGNVSDSVFYPNVILDTTGPILNITKPDSNMVNKFLTVEIAGNSNEPLAEVEVNGVNMTIENNLLNFGGLYTAAMEGEESLTFIARDIVGNTSTTVINVQIIIDLIREELITIGPDNDGSLIVAGLPGSVYPGIELFLDGGIFNQESVTANPDGSFEVSMSYFQKVLISAELPEFDRFEAVTINYNQDTTLSGIVRDIDDTPLPGVVVTIESSGQSAITNEAGVFSIDSPITGDQRLEIDATRVAEAVTSGEKYFNKTNLFVSIGPRQNNVIEDVIYFSPIYLNDPDSDFNAGTGGIVSSIRAPGFQLNIPANNTIFPDRAIANKISISEVASNKVSVPAPDFVEPDTVYALEPSGLKFTNRVEVTLPNVNELEPNAEVVILSKNSETGLWEVDGAAKVDPSGSFIRTKPGAGISHFSEIFAAPFGPRVSEYGDTDRPGIDVFNGAVSNSISLPSYKSLGQDISPSLIYNSRWADPNIVVSNLFDIPRNEQLVTGSSSGGLGDAFKVEQTVTVQSWVVPEYIEATFQAEEFQTDPIRFTGVPNKSLITYAADLSTKESGVTSYISHYDIKLRQMTLRTERKRSRKLGRRKTRIYQTLSSELIEQIFPSDLIGNTSLINKKNSKAGVGWKIGGVQKITNPEDARILIEEADGSQSVYNLSNSIETMFEDPNELKAVELDNYPILKYVNSSNSIATVNLISNSTSIQGVPEIPVQLSIAVGKSWINVNPPIDFSYARCNRYQMNTFKRRSISSLFSNGTDNYLLESDGQVTLLNSTLTKLAGKTQAPPNIKKENFSGYHNVGVSPFINGIGDAYLNITDYPDYLEACEEYTGRSCSASEVVATSNVGALFQPINYTDICEPVGARILFDGTTGYFPTSGEVPSPGFSDGNVADAQFNNPTDIIPASTLNGLVIADKGNNCIRQIDLATGQVTTIAGNRQSGYSGDGRLATNAEIFHPNNIIYDIDGNLYISTEDGYIRKVDPSGRIETFAGLSFADGGILADEVRKEKLLLNNPMGMVIDNENSYLYVADSGHNRVVQIDLIEGIAKTVAGNGQCVQGNIGDNGSALAASLCHPSDVGLDNNQNLLILDKGHNKIRRVIFNAAQGGQLSFSPGSKDNSRLFKLADGSFQRQYRNGTIINYNKHGQQLEQIDRTGRAVSFFYDNTKLIRVQDPAGRETIYNYTNNNLLDSITDPAGRTTYFTYQGSLLTEVTFPDLTTRRFEYDGYGNMTAEYDQNSNRTEYMYNEWRRLIGVKRADASMIEMEDSASALISNNYNSSNPGELTSIDDASQTDGIKDAKGNVTTFNKDINGYVSEIADAEDKITTIERNIDGLPTKITRPDTSYTTFTYDPSNNDLISQFDSSSGTTTSQVFDQYGNLLNATNARGFSSQNIYNAQGLISSQVDARGNATTRTYYPLGLIHTIKQPLGQTSTFEYDNYGNLSKRINAEGNVTEYTRDNAGNILEMKNAKGDITKYSYDEFNRLTSVTTPNGYITTYFYRASGELSKILDPESNETKFFYDTLGRLTTKVDPLNNTTSLFYDKNGNVEREIDPNGSTKNFEYDKLNQLKKKTLPDNLYEMVYDVRGNLKSINDKNSNIDFEYTIVNGESVVNESLFNSNDISYTLNYSYDAIGNRKSMASDYNSATYNYDELNRLTSVVNHKGEAFSFAYDNNSRLTTINRPGSQTSFSFDNTNFLTSIIHNRSGGTIGYFTYTRDAIGNRTSAGREIGSHSYTYDADGQLLSATNPDVEVPYQNEVFEYDKLGNRTKFNDKTYEFDGKKQRLTADHKYLYTYDANGNMLSKQDKILGGEKWDYTYTSENQLIAVAHTKPGGTIVSRYTYDALGRRIRKEVVNNSALQTLTIRNYAYDGQEIIAETDEDEKVLGVYTHSTLRTDDVLAVDVKSDGVGKLAQYQGSYFYNKDGLGSITHITNGSGQLVQRHNYTSYGKMYIKDGLGNDITSNPVLSSSYSFTGREYDAETDMYYYRARYYDYSVGRFIQADPDPGRITQPTTVNNKYTYVLNNPTRYLDPSGENPLVIAALVGAALGIIFAPPGTPWYEAALIGAVSAVTAVYVGGIVASAIGETATLGGAIAKGTAVGATVGATNTATTLFLRGEDITEGKNIAKIVTSAAIGGAFGAAGGYLGYSRNIPGVQKGIEVNNAIYDEAGQRLIDYTDIQMRLIECAPFAANGDSSSYNKCMGYN